MTQTGEGTHNAAAIKDEVEERHTLEVSYCYPDGLPVEGTYIAIDSKGFEYRGSFNDKGKLLLNALPAGSVAVTFIEGETKQYLETMRGKVEDALKGILSEKQAGQGGMASKGLWTGAVGLIEFAWGDGKTGAEIKQHLSPIDDLNKHLEASYKAYQTGSLTEKKWLESLENKMQPMALKTLIRLLGFLPEKTKSKWIVDAYEFSTYFAADDATLDILKKFAEKYVGAESGQAWKAFTGGGIFEIVLAARLVGLGSVGLASDVSSEIHHADRLRNLGHHFLRLFGWLKLKQLYKQAEVGVDRKHQFEAEMPAMVRLTRGDGGQLEDSDATENAAMMRRDVVPDKFELSASDIAKLKANQYAHTLERHGPDITTDQLKRRATEGIAPDNSFIPKFQGGNRVGNVIPPLSSKFESAESLKLALDSVDTNTQAFANALAQAQSNLLPGQSLTRFKFQVDLGWKLGFGFQRPEGAPNFVLIGGKLSGASIKVDNLTNVEARYQVNPNTGNFELNTLFPAQ